jgi:hypothetical protein
MSNFLRGQIAQPAVGFFGATEIQLRHWPIRTNTPYPKTGRVICVGVTDKTEFVWVESELTDVRGWLIAENAPPDALDEGLVATLESLRPSLSGARHVGDAP